MANPYKELRLAIEKGDSLKVNELLDSGLSMEVGHVLAAIQNKDTIMLKLFLDRGWDINTDVSNIIPSALVYTFEDMKLLKWFLSHGANPNKSCRIRDCTPLSFAVRDASLDIVKCLFEHGGQVQHGQLLHYASMRTRDSNCEVLRFIYNLDPGYNKLRINNLLDEGSRNYLMNERSGLCTPLHYAAICGSVDRVNFLLDKGAIPDLLDPYRRSAISYAIYNRHDDVEQLLKERLTGETTRAILVDGSHIDGIS
ncbi:ankyrin [Aspergillus sclerotioniger CBS 115572]|uniref:Ankyrin n=1 Tax=Aspergillus sclerotioniger CBS 115572 TaxID=1450535 RepID=A0A317V9V6_9EURO|nr:ankyrin [Aspergillus sclerotioniger CBS 115572]PWY71114.1 ankyrin [Aspergillus sclerotioniger CBS 115572]